MQLTPDADLIERAKEALIAALGSNYADRKILLAVSGGGDSVAMMHMVASLIPAEKLHVVTVNHQLRPEAEDEVSLVTSYCTNLGVACTASNWHWNGHGNLQAEARAGRWALFRDVALQMACEAVLVGQTEDDQVENFFLRLARGSGVDGLSGMTISSRRDGVHVVRPLLNCGRQDLRHWLQDRGLSWADDPSNDDTKYGRVKARRMLEQLETLGLTRKRVLQTVAHMNSASEALAEATRRFAQAHCRSECGDVVINLPDEQDSDSEVMRRIVSAAVQWVGGGAYRPRIDALRATVATAIAGHRSTLQGCVLSCENNALRVVRELAATSEVVFADAVSSTVWDRRWIVTASQDLSDHVVRALGEDGLAYCPNWRQLGVPRATLLTTPSVWSNGTLIAAPIAGYEKGWSARIVADFEEWLVTH